MIRRFYSLVMRGAQPLLRRKLRRRGAAEPGYLEAVDERFGHYEAPAMPGALWVHAVSLGETRAAAILVKALRERDPSLRLLLTHGTATGRAEGTEAAARGRRAGLAAVGHAAGGAALPRAFPAGRRRADGDRGLAEPGGGLPRRPRAAGAGQRPPVRQVAAAGAAHEAAGAPRVRVAARRVGADRCRRAAAGPHRRQGVGRVRQPEVRCATRRAPAGPGAAVARALDRSPC